MKRLNTLALAIILSSAPAFAGVDGHGQKKMNHDDMESGEMAHGDTGGHAMSDVGMPAKAAQAVQTVNVTLTDAMKIKFDQPLNIKQGDIIRFIVTNKGKITHEFNIGSKQEQIKHRDMMRDMSMSGMGHDDGSVLSLEAGQKGELTWQFMAKKPHVEFACNIPGHAEAGMTMDYMLRTK